MSLERAFALSAFRPDQEEALGRYEELWSQYPQEALAADGLLRSGRILEARGDEGPARERYRWLLAEMGESPLAPLAQSRLEGLGKVAVVRGVRTGVGPGHTRVVVDLSHASPYEPRALPADPGANKPPRVFLEFPAARLGDGVPRETAVGNHTVLQVRVGQHDPRTARVVIDLAGPASFRVFPLEDPARVVVDVFGASRAPEEPPPGGRRPRVVVDPGHGGKDPGALGPGGLKEKDLTLAIAVELAEFLRRDAGYEVRLTRDRDATLSLEERTAIANAFGADLFVSIHVNASPSAAAMGVETYYLERASDRASRRLAARENGSSEAGVAAVEHILADVILTSKTRESRRLATAIQHTLVGHLSQAYGPVRDLGVKRAPFYVLTGAVMPAVLVEAAFLSNPEEAKRLADPAYRREAALAVARGVRQFLEGT